MDFEIPEEINDLLDEIDVFIADEIKPLEEEHEQFFNYRREDARTNWEDGTPRQEWEELLAEARKRADEAGFYRYILPEEYGGMDGTNLGMAITREHLAKKGPGLHNVLQSEASVVGNFSSAELIMEFGDDAQKDKHLEPMIEGESGMAFGLTEPNHGSDATYLETTAEKEGDEWVINGNKRWTTGMHIAPLMLVFARTSGEPGDHTGITGFIVPTDTDGLDVDYFHWTLNMPTDHAEVTLDDVRVPERAILGEKGNGLLLGQAFVHEGRIRQAAASTGAAQFCIDESIEFAKQRETWGRPLAHRQAIQFPIVDLQAETEMLRSFIFKTAWQLDQDDQDPLELTDKVSMANYRSNQLVCDAADRAMQIHGGQGYSRHKPFEHVYRHHRRYRITEGAEEIQKRRIAGRLFDIV